MNRDYDFDQDAAAADDAAQEYFQRLDPRTRMTPAEEDELALWLDNMEAVHLAPGGEPEAA